MDRIQVHKMDDGRFAVFWINVYGKVDMCIYVTRNEIEDLVTEGKKVLEGWKA